MTNLALLALHDILPYIFYSVLAGMAILVYDEFGRQAAAIHKLYQDNVAVFEDRRKAIIWLKNLLEETSN